MQKQFKKSVALSEECLAIDPLNVKALLNRATMNTQLAALLGQTPLALEIQKNCMAVAKPSGLVHHSETIFPCRSRCLSCRYSRHRVSAGAFGLVQRADIKTSKKKDMAAQAGAIGLSLYWLGLEVI